LKLACSPNEETNDAEEPIQRRTDHSLPGSALRSNVTRGGILKEHQAGIGAKELCRKHGISDGTFYKWRSKYGGMEVSEAKRLKALEAENAKLKKMLAEHMLDVATLKEMLGKNF
jgi:putative transposase